MERIRLNDLLTTELIYEALAALEVSAALPVRVPLRRYGWR